MIQKSLTIKELRDRILPDLSTMRAMKNKDLTIAHCFYDVTQTNNTVFREYGIRLEMICNLLDITYRPIKLVDENYKLQDAMEIINELNDDDSVTGIMIDNPFRKSPFGNYFTNELNPEKDIECVTPENYGKYILHDNHTKTPPMVNLLSTLSIISGLNCEYRKILILTSTYADHKGIMARTNLNNDTITVCNIIETDFLKKNIDDYDIIISVNYNTNRALNDVLCGNRLYNKLVLDFGWMAKTYDNSIDKGLFGMNTAFYDLRNGLIDLYIMESICNMLK